MPEPLDTAELVENMRDQAAHPCMWNTADADNASSLLKLGADRLESLEHDNRELRRKLAELQARLRDRTHEADEYRADAEAWQDYQYRMACGLRRPK